MSNGQIQHGTSFGFSEPRAVVHEPAGTTTEFDPFPSLSRHYGFVPGLFHAQTLLPRLLGPQLRITEVILLRDGALSRRLKEVIGLTIGVERRNHYGVAMHWEGLRRQAAHDAGAEKTLPGATELGASDRAALHFALRVGRLTPSITAADFAPLRGAGLTDLHVLEAAAVAALAVFECTVAAALRVPPDFDVPDMAALDWLVNVEGPGARPTDDRPLAAASGLDVERTAPLPFLKETLGLVPNLFRILMARPDLAEAVASALRHVLLSDNALSRTQKQNIFLVISAARLNTYCVAAHCEMLRGLGMSVERADQIAVDHRYADLSDGDKVLLDGALALSVQPSRFWSGERRRLRGHGFSEQQILEAVVMSGFAQFLNALSIGLAAEPDFEPPPAFAVKARAESAPTVTTPGPDAPGDVRPTPDIDPDGTIVSRVQQGEIGAFEDLVRRHGRRVRGTLAGILRRDEDIEDAVQDTFVRAFQHIASFHGRSRFLTWLTRIAINTALQRLRGRRKFAELTESLDTAETVYPRSLQTWLPDPEAAYSRIAMRELVLKAVRNLPIKYRIVVVLRDLQQLSTAETAAALDLGVPGVKARLFRGRLMLREALAPYFAENGNDEPS